MGEKGKIALFLILVIFFVVLLSIPKVRHFIFRKVLPHRQAQTQQNPVLKQAENFLRGTPEEEKQEAPTPSPRPSPSSSPVSKSQQYGINTGLGINETFMPQVAAKMAETGVGLIRGQCDWRNVEPSDNQWDWSKCDYFMNYALSNKLEPVVQLWLDSKWCRMAPKDATGTKPKPVCSDEQFQDYVTQVVNHNKGKAIYYEVGNEPDLQPEWRDSPSEYAKTLHLAYQAIKQADPNAKVVLGGLAACSGQNCSKNFAPAILNDSKYPALRNLDIVNYHTYAKRQDMASLYNKIRSAVGNKPIWVTEVGFPSDARYQQARRPGYGYPDGEEGQAAYMKDVLPYLLNLGVEKVFWYNSVDVPSDKGEFCTYGLLYIPGKQCTGSPASGELATKQAYDAYKQIISR